jgi:imidazolonepropionase-like amidohydrolase
VEDALAAITINAAQVIGMADEVGSIRAGKKADFTVLAQDPLAIDPLHLKDIRIVSTVYEGVPYPIEEGAG